MTDSEWTIRPAEPTDVEQIFGLIVELAEHQRAADQVATTPGRLAESLFPDGSKAALWGHVAVETSTGAVGGMVLWFLNYSTWEGHHGIHVEDLYVQPALRGHHIGRRLLAAVAQVAVERGYARFELSVIDWNTPSIEFYKRLGGEPLTEWIGYRFEPNRLQSLASDGQDL